MGGAPPKPRVAVAAKADNNAGAPPWRKESFCKIMRMYARPKKYGAGTIYKEIRKVRIFESQLERKHQGIVL